MTTTYLPEVPLTKIKPHPKNPRLELTDIDELAASITSQGLLEHLVLAPPTGSSVAYTLIAGHRRLAAAKVAGLKAVPATLREDLDTPAKQLAAILSENTQRVDLSPVEEADAFTQLVAFPGMTQKKAAEQTGRSATFVKQRLALAKLPEAARKKIHSGEITLDQAATIASFVGTPDYKAIVQAAGTSNFTFTVQRAKDNAKDRERIEILKTYAAERGWKVTSSWSEIGSSVIERWNLKGDLSKALDVLPDTEHVVFIDGTRWSVSLPPTAKQTTDRGGVSTPAQREAEAKRTQHHEDVQTARRARASWLTGRLQTLVLKPDEILAVLRIIARQNADQDYGFANPESHALAGVPTDDEPDLDAWAANLTLNEAWRAVLALTFDAATCGSSHGAWEQEPSIRLALALGYEPSDVELALITPEVKA